MSQTESENTGEFIRRRFSLTTEVNSLIDELAEENYGGNRSACVRAAVYAMHQRRDEDELRHGLKRLQKEIEALTEQVESLQELHQSGGHQSDQSLSSEVTREIPATPVDGKSDKKSDSESHARVAREVYHVMRDEEKTVFELEELLAEVDYSLSLVAEGIELLVQQQAIERLDTGQCPQYQIIDS